MLPQALFLHHNHECARTRRHPTRVSICEKDFTIEPRREGINPCMYARVEDLRVKVVRGVAGGRGSRRWAQGGIGNSRFRFGSGRVFGNGHCAVVSVVRRSNTVFHRWTAAPYGWGEIVERRLTLGLGGRLDRRGLCYARH